MQQHFLICFVSYHHRNNFFHFYNLRLLFFPPKGTVLKKSSCKGAGTLSRNCLCFYNQVIVFYDIGQTNYLRQVFTLMPLHVSACMCVREHRTELTFCAEGERLCSYL